MHERGSVLKGMLWFKELLFLGLKVKLEGYFVEPSKTEEEEEEFKDPKIKDDVETANCWCSRLTHQKIEKKITKNILSEWRFLKKRIWGMEKRGRVRS